MSTVEQIKANPVILNPDVRHDFKFEWEVKNGNPNGDPDSDGIRQTPDGYALATDVCVKRWIRDYMDEVAGKPIYISRKIKEEPDGQRTLKHWANKHEVKNGGDAVKTFIDVRLFGGVVILTKKVAKGAPVEDKERIESENIEGGENGQILGPIQIGYGRSSEPVDEQDITVSRVVRQESDSKDGTFGHRQMVAHAVMEQRGRYSGHLGKRAGVSSDDLELFWTALIEGADLRRSTMRGKRHFARLTILTFPDAYGHGEPVKTELTFQDVWEKYGSKKS